MLRCHRNRRKRAVYRALAGVTRA